MEALSKAATQKPGIVGYDPDQKKVSGYTPQVDKVVGYDPTIKQVESYNPVVKKVRNYTPGIKGVVGFEPTTDKVLHAFLAEVDKAETKDEQREVWGIYLSALKKLGLSRKDAERRMKFWWKNDIGGQVDEMAME